MNGTDVLHTTQTHEESCHLEYLMHLQNKTTQNKYENKIQRVKFVTL